MAKEFPNEDLLAAYRDGTRQASPPSLSQAVRDRLARSRLVLPKVLLTGLGGSMGLAAVTAILLTLREFPPRTPSSEPPPIFGDLQSDLFDETVSLPSQ